MSSGSRHNIYQLRNVYLNVAERCAFMDGKPLKLTPRTFDLLSLLVEKKGELVSKEEIWKHVWDGSFVEEGNLPVHISAIRRLLKEDPERKFIETVSGKGYRFVAPVKELDSPEWPRVFGDDHARRSTTHELSYKHYLKGKHFAAKRTVPDLHKAIDCLERSISCDPSNIASHVEMVEAYLLLYLFESLSYEDTLAKIDPILAVIPELDNSLAGVHSMYGALNTHLFWRFNEAKEQFRRAVELDPTCMKTRYRYSNCLTMLGDLPDALDQLEDIFRIDPLSVFTYKMIGKLYFKMRENDKALSYLKEALEMEPGDTEALVTFGAVLTNVGEYDQAIAAFEQALGKRHDIELLILIGCVHARAGRAAEAMQILERVERERTGYVSEYLKAVFYAALKHTEDAFSSLEAAFDRREADLTALKVDPRLDHLRSDKRFDRLVRRVGLTARV